jgi:hypothetical protein
MHQNTHNLVQYFWKWPLRREGQLDRHLLSFHLTTGIKNAAPSGRTVLGVGLRPLACWYYGFESRRGHGCLSVVCCQVQVSATSWSLVQRSSTECDWCRDLYLTTHNNHNRQISMPPTVFEPTFPASERPQSHVLDRAVIGFDSQTLSVPLIFTQSVKYVLFTDLTVICATADCK